MHDPRAGGHHAEVIQGLLAPLEEGVALAVALVLLVHVVEEGVLGAEVIDLDRVVDDEVHWNLRVDLLGIRPEAGHRAAERGQVHHRGNAREVLQDHAGELQGHVDLPGLRLPLG